MNPHSCPCSFNSVLRLLRSVDCLYYGANTGQIDNTRIGCIGRGLGGLLTLYAAALDQRVFATVVWQTPVSYHELIVEHPAFPASAYLFDVLNHFDLPDLMATIAPRPILIADLVDGQRQPRSPLAIADLCAWPRQIYTLWQEGKNTEQTFAIEEQSVTPNRIVSWLQLNLKVVRNSIYEIAA